jgi:lipoyl synthase
MQHLDDRLNRARERSWRRFGKQITFYLPGMFTYDGLRGKYPAISITGSRCALQCEHCRGRTLDGMISAGTSDSLLETCLRLDEKGSLGVLISGGCDEEGRLPLNDIIPAIGEVKRRTGLHVSIHCGFIDFQTALLLKESGVDEALIDVIGDDQTYQHIYHLRSGVSRIEQSLAALQKAELPVVPHIVCGLHYGKMKGERKAVEIISRFELRQVVIVSLMGIPGTPLWGTTPPGPEEIADIIAETRFKVPEASISLGCARQRGNISIEILAIDAGVNRMALPSEEAIRHAGDYGLEIRYQKTCCSVSRDFSLVNW